jgi:hypothetical protein
MQFSGNRFPPPPFRVNRAHPLARGLVGAWFPNISLAYQGLMLDISGNGFNASQPTAGTNSHSTIDRLSAIGVIPSADYRVTLPSWIDLTAGYTMAAWTAVPAVNTYAMALGDSVTNKGPHLGRFTTGPFRHGVWGDGVIDVTPTISANEPLLLAGVFDASGAGSLYENGRQIGSGTLTFTTPTNNYVWLGSLPNGASNATVPVAAWMLWSRPLSAAEMWSLYAPQTRWGLISKPDMRSVVPLVAAGGAATILPYNIANLSKIDGVLSSGMSKFLGVDL